MNVSKREGPAMKKICFFARVGDPEILDRVQFYAQDLRALRQTNIQVVVATSWRTIPWDADIYFAWWWTWAFMPILKATLRRRPTIITGVLNIDCPGLEFSSRTWPQRTAIRLALRKARVNIFVSRAELNAAIERLDVKNAIYCPLGVDTVRYSPGLARRKDNVIATIAWLGSKNAVRKCIPEIVEAIPLVLAEWPDARFVIAGLQGEAYPSLRLRARQLGVDAQIDWLGVIPEAEKIQLLRECFAYLQPSRWEGFGLAILEAMSCGAPVICSPVGAVPEVVGGAGVMVDGASAPSIAQSILRLHRSLAEAARLGEEGRKRAVLLYKEEQRVSGINSIMQNLTRRVGGE